jgi:hypothetical protein
VRYLGEREVGFDPSGLGFPSLDGCQAIVYQTDNGLFGYHNFGGADEASWPERSAAFGSFVNEHFMRATGRILYGVCYVTTARGYGNSHTTRKWKGELASFADAVGFDGPIWGYNLSNSGIAPGAYVELRKNGNACEVWAKHWSDADRTKGINSGPMYHRIIMRRQKPDGSGYDTKVEAQNLKIATNVNPAGMVQFQLERLRK